MGGNGTSGEHDRLRGDRQLVGRLGRFFIGVATIVIVGTAIRRLVPKYRRAGLAWGLVFGLILLGIGLNGIAE